MEFILGLGSQIFVKGDAPIYTYVLAPFVLKRAQLLARLRFATRFIMRYLYITIRYTLTGRINAAFALLIIINDNVISSRVIHEMNTDYDKARLAHLNADYKPLREYSAE